VGNHTCVFRLVLHHTCYAGGVHHCTTVNLSASCRGLAKYLYITQNGLKKRTESAHLCKRLLSTIEHDSLAACDGFR
jgi:hypothetical protein